jgi:hypothetical protein
VTAAFLFCWNARLLDGRMTWLKGIPASRSSEGHSTGMNRKSETVLYWTLCGKELQSGAKKRERYSKEFRRQTVESAAIMRVLLRALSLPRAFLLAATCRGAERAPS